MDNKIFYTRISNRRDTEAEWELSNPILLDGEIIIVRTDNETRLKVGDGFKTYKELPFLDDHLRNLLTGEFIVDLTGEISESFKDGAWSPTNIVDNDNVDAALYVTRVSLSDFGKENSNPDVVLRDSNGFEYKGNKRSDYNNIYFYSNAPIAGVLSVNFGSKEDIVDITSDISSSFVDGKWSLTSVVDEQNTNIAKYVTRTSLNVNNIDKRSPEIFIKDENGFVIEALKKISSDYVYIYSNNTISGKIVILF